MSLYELFFSGDKGRAKKNLIIVKSKNIRKEVVQTYGLQIYFPKHNLTMEQNVPRNITRLLKTHWYSS